MEKMLHAIQDVYPEDVAWCYGCGRLNESGHHFRTSWDGENTVTIFTPKPEHTAVPGFVYGGLIASLIDCHGTGSTSLYLHTFSPPEQATKLKTINTVTKNAPSFLPFWTISFSIFLKPAES